VQTSPATLTNRVEGQTFSQPLQQTVERVAPTHGLFQPCYNLSEADFLRLQQSSPVLAAVGGAITSFSLSYLLPVTVEFFLKPVGARGSFPVAALWVGMGSLAVGLVLLGASLVFSRERHRVMKRIRHHFDSNPSELEYRGTPQ